MTRIEQLISEIEEYFDECKPYGFSSSKIIVDKSIIEDQLVELRKRMPDEVQKYKKLIENKNAIINDAKEQAENIINAAQVKTEGLINEHEIMQRAIEQAALTVQDATIQAQTIVDKATMQANDIRSSAVVYTDEMLANLQVIIEHAIDSSKQYYDNLLSNLDNNLRVVVSNRNELRQNNSSADYDD